MRDSRVVVCGSRRWPWPDTIETVLDRLAVRHGDRLAVIEGAATGAGRAAHRWCTRHELPSWRHRCYPVAWAAERTRRPHTWHLTGQDRHLQMLLDEEPGLVLAFHEDFDPTANGTAETCLRAILLGVPVWLVPTAAPAFGGWLTTPDYGLAGAVWAADPDAAAAFARGMDTGQVDINGGRFNPLAPFGGYKASGVGRELGRHGFEEFLQTKSLQF